MNSAAVVIGVDRTGGLTPLAAAASGAEEMADWLEQDGYEVTCITDAPDPGTAALRPVTRKVILDAVTAFVSRGNVEKLVVYFAGHGYLNSASEIWLLSGAPDDPNEAVDQTTSADLARNCNIRNVVFISDSCRSIPPGRLGQRVNGASIFPNRPAGNVDVHIDHFFATRPGEAAIEADVPELAKASGLFTKVLKESHFDPPRNKLIVADRKPVVPSRWLQTVLPDRVDEEAQRKSLALTQRAQLRLETDESAFVGLARFTKASPRSRPPSPPPNVIGFIPFGGPSDFGMDWPEPEPEPPPEPEPKPAEMPSALRQYSSLLSDAASTPDLLEIESHARSLLGADADREALPSAEFPAWVKVTGAGVRRVDVTKPCKARLPSQSPDETTIGVTLPTQARACSVAIEFGDGSGTVVAALRDYECRVVVSDSGVQDVSYAPFRGNMAGIYMNMHQIIDRTRAVASAAAARGLLAVDRDSAAQLAETTRRFKMFDPALGMVAALAYAAAGRRREAASVLRYSRRDLQVDLFDLWLLAGAGPSNFPHYPLCPMMTQSWSFLEGRKVELPSALRAAGKHSGFWTTFAKGEMNMVFAALGDEDLK